RLQPAVFEQRADRGRGEAFAEGRDDAAGDEDVFHGCEEVERVRMASTWAACSGVSTPGEVSSVGRTLMDAPFSSARSCSSDSARSSGEGGQVTKRSRKV